MRWMILPLLLAMLAACAGAPKAPASCPAGAPRTPLPGAPS
jgi:hypothetical protein